MTQAFWDMATCHYFSVSSRLKWMQSFWTLGKSNAAQQPNLPDPNQETRCTNIKTYTIQEEPRLGLLDLKDVGTITLRNVGIYYRPNHISLTSKKTWTFDVVGKKTVNDSRRVMCSLTFHCSFHNRLLASYPEPHKSNTFSKAIGVRWGIF